MEHLWLAETLYLLAGLLKQKFEDKNSEFPIMLHCTIHQENLVAKSLKMDNVKQAANFI